MKKFVLIILIMALSACFLIGCGAKSEGEGEDAVPAGAEKLIVYNWADYVDEDLNKEFEAYYKSVTGKDLHVEYNTFETNEEIITKVISGSLTVDILCPSEYAIEKLMRSGVVKPIDLSKITNYANVNEDIMSNITKTFGGMEVGGKELNMLDYMVPYMWGTLGILYNEDVVTEADLAENWGLLWNDAKNDKLVGKILMKDSVRDTYVAAVLYAKQKGMLPAEYDAKPIQELINTVDQQLLDIAEKVLLDQRSILRGYEVDFGKDDMIKGYAYADLAWSGDAIYAIEEGEVEGVDVPLNYFVPDIGSNLWFDGWVMMKNAKNQRAAEMYIDYMLRPNSAVRNMMTVGYTSAVAREVLMEDEEVLSILEENEYDIEEYFANEVRYPVITDKLGVMKDFGDQNEAAIKMWENIKAGSTVPLLVITSVVVGLMLLIVIIYLLKGLIARHPRRIINK